MPDHAIAPKYSKCYILICAWPLASCRKTFVTEGTCVEQCAGQSTQRLCPEAPLVFSLQVQLWESSARDRARDSVPESKEVAPGCQQGHL